MLDESRKRAERLRRVRNLTNLSRKQLCEQAGININTYIGYEVGRYGGLTEKGAKTILHYAIQEGVYCTFEWLMFGIGEPPHIVLESVLTEYSPETNNEQSFIAKELQVFKNHYPQAIDYRIADDGMLPLYAVGDYVAGVSSTIESLVGLTCIVTVSQGSRLVRNLHAGKKKHHYTLFCLNPATTVTVPILYDVKLVEAAEVLWHRKVNNR